MDHVRRDPFRPNDLEPVHREQVLQGRERVVAQVLVIDGVVLQRLEQRDPVCDSEMKIPSLSSIDTRLFTTAEGFSMCAKTLDAVTPSPAVLLSRPGRPDVL